MDIHTLAAELVEQLRPGCERIEIAGSIRRGKADPKDIEIVAVAKMDWECVHDLWGSVIDRESVDLLDKQINELRFAGEWDFDHVLKRAGSKYKRLRHIVSGYCCDLFIADASNWGNILTIRTGPGDFSRELVTRAHRYGLKQDGGQLWREHRDGTCTVIPCPEERNFFAALKVPYLEPSERTVEILRKAVLV